MERRLTCNLVSLVDSKGRPGRTKHGGAKGPGPKGTFVAEEEVTKSSRRGTETCVADIHYRLEGGRDHVGSRVS